MWPKKEVPFINSLLKFSNDVTEVNHSDIVSDSELGITSGWENVRPRAIYRSNKCTGRRKLKTTGVVAPSPVMKKQNDNSTHVMRGTLDDSWNYQYPTGHCTSSSNKTLGARDNIIEEIAEDVTKETNNTEQREQANVQRLREAIAALVRRDHLLHRTHATDQEAEMLTQQSDKTTYRWGVEKPKMPHGGVQVMTQLKGPRKVLTISHKPSLDCNELLNVRQLPVGTWRGKQTVKQHKVLDPTVRYELSQLIQSQLYSQLLQEQQSVRDQLLKVSSVLLLPPSSAQHSELQGSHSYPNINNRTGFSMNNRTTLHKHSLPRKF